MLLGKHEALGEDIGHPEENISSLTLTFNESGEVSWRFEAEPCLSIFTLCGCVCELLNTWSLRCVT